MKHSVARSNISVSRLYCIKNNSKQLDMWWNESYKLNDTIMKMMFKLEWMVKARTNPRIVQPVCQFTQNLDCIDTICVRWLILSWMRGKRNKNTEDEEEAEEKIQENKQLEMMIREKSSTIITMCLLYGKYYNHWCVCLSAA